MHVPGTEVLPIQIEGLQLVQTHLLTKKSIVERQDVLAASTWCKKDDHVFEGNRQ
jgi:hypothetical protein